MKGGKPETAFLSEAPAMLWDNIHGLLFMFPLFAVFLHKPHENSVG